MSFDLYLKYKQKELFSDNPHEKIYDLLSKRFGQSIQKGFVLEKEETLITAGSLEEAFDKASQELNCDLSRLAIPRCGARETKLFRNGRLSV